VRGTGASLGAWPYPWQKDTIQDSYEIVDWIVSQPWSNGHVAGWGISYLGTTAELLPASGHPAVKASIAMFNHPDPFLDISFPGGVFNERFIREWGRMDSQLDNNIIPKELGLLALLMVKGVKPVEGAEALFDEAYAPTGITATFKALQKTSPSAIRYILVSGVASMTCKLNNTGDQSKSPERRSVVGGVGWMQELPTP